MLKAQAEGVSGKAVTPALLSEFARHTDGLSVQVNRDLVVANALLAGQVASSLSSLSE
jgi:pseudouridine-5'-phosphate glycosidase